MRKGETKPKIEFFSQKSTTERNGTEIKLYIKSEIDLIKFLHECSNQLYFFKNVVFDIDELKNYYDHRICSMADNLQKNYYIIEGDNFISRTDSPGNITQLCMSIGNVKYPIDWENLGISTIHLPLALKFDIGEIQVIYTREDVRYTEENKKKIFQKIEDLKEELVKKYNKSTEIEFNNWNQFSHYISNDLYVLQFNKGTDKELNIPLKSFINNVSDLNPVQIKDFPYRFNNLVECDKIRRNISSLTLNQGQYHYHHNSIIDWKVQKTFKTNGNIRSWKGSEIKLSSWNDISPNNIGIHNSGIDQIKSRILDTKNNLRSKLLFETKNKSYSVKKNKYIFKVLYPDVDPIDTWILSDLNFKIPYKFKKKFIENTSSYFDSRTAFNIIKYFVKDFEKEFKDVVKSYDDIVVDEAWWKKEQAENRTNVDYDRSLMAIERVYPSSWRGEGVEYDRKDYRVDIDTYVNKTHIRRIILNKSDDLHMSNVSTSRDMNTFLEDLMLVTNQLTNRKLISNTFQINVMSERNYNKVLKFKNNTSNIYTLEEFKNDNKIQTKVLGRVATVVKIADFFNNHTSVKYGNGSYARDQVIENLFEGTTIRDEYKEIMDYIDEGTRLNIDDVEKFIEDCDNLDSVTEIYDRDIINMFNRVFILFSEYNISYVDDEVRSLFKFVKEFKPKSSYYKLRKEFHKQLNSFEDYYKLIDDTRDIDTLSEDDKQLLIKSNISKYSSYTYKNILTLLYLDTINKKQLNIN